MAATHEIRTGARVTGERGKKLGVVDEVRTDPVSGRPTAFVVKSGFWLLSKRRVLAVDTIRQVNNDPDTIIVNVSKSEFRGIPELQR